MITGIDNQESDVAYLQSVSKLAVILQFLVLSVFLYVCVIALYQLAIKNCYF